MLAVGVLLLPTCKKDPDLRMPDLQNGVIPLVVKDDTKDVSISFLDLAGFEATINVGLYYDDAPKSMNLMVSMNGDYENIAVVKSDITSFPTAVNVTTADLVALLPGLESIDSLQLGDYFLFYVDVTLNDGTVVYGHDTLYDAYNSSIVNLPGSSVNVIYEVLCPFDAAKTVGDYAAVSVDWNASGDVTFTADAEDPYTVYIDGLMDVDFLTGNGNTLPIYIDPATYEITGEATVLAANCGDWGPDYEGYTNYTYSPVSGTYSTCDGTYTIKFEIYVDQGSFGEYTYTFTRQ